MWGSSCHHLPAVQHPWPPVPPAWLLLGGEERPGKGGPAPALVGGVRVTLAGAKLPVTETQEVYWTGTHALCLQLREPLLPPPVLRALDQLSSKQLNKGAQSFIRAETPGGRE